jgi:hypothetical protein
LEILEGYPEFNAIKYMLKSIGWYPFLRNFKGHNDHVTKSFAEGFGARVACIRDLVMEIS